MKKMWNNWKNLFDIKWLNNLLFWGALVVLPLIWAYTPDFFRLDEIPSFWEYIWQRRKMAILSYIILALIFVALTFLCRRIVVSSLIMSGIVICAGIANYFKLLYRKSALVPLDIKQLKDALAVTKEDVTLHLTKEMYMMIVIFILIALILWYIRLPEQFRVGGASIKLFLLNGTVIIASVLLSVVMVVKVLQNETLMKDWGFKISPSTVNSSYFNTFFTNFFYMTRYLSMEPPADYDKESMDKIGETLSQNKTSTEIASSPDIILLVAESWHFLDKYNLQFSEDPFANYKTLAEEGVSGLIFSPYYGGGTANVEYELLTGLPSQGGEYSGTVFNDSIYPGFPSITNYYKDSGYETIALHAYTDVLYNRATAYAYLGFDCSYFSDSFENPNYSGNYISDTSCVDKIIELYRGAESADSPIMIHALTMQGHLTYDMNRLEGEENTIDVEGESYTEEQLQTLSIVSTAFGETDRAIGKLTDYLSNCERDVVLIVVGDHQTPISSEKNDLGVLEQIGVYEQLDLMSVRTTPYLVWTNFEADMPETFGTITHNMLLPRTLLALKANRPQYFDYLVESMSCLNGIDSGYLIGLDGRLCENPTTEQLAEAAERELVRYDIVNGKQYINDSLYFSDP